MKVEVKVRSYDFDPLGVTHFLSYFRFISEAFEELMEAAVRRKAMPKPGVRLKAVEVFGVSLPITKAECRYLAPTRFGELLEVKPELEELQPSHLTIKYKISRKSNGQLVAEARTRHVAVDKSWRRAEIPGELVEIVENLLEDRAEGET
ncbi:MAG: 4-hydroxybenzoyl-CoA thioesterase [Candidatus Hecatellales archaeon B24]|nr:MAG: 4-hydroxybenzoyl-CoA thioesterase [Candidatus Hecatellales archaeon B24]